MNYGIFSGLNEWSVLVRVVLSVILGGAVGFERGKHGRAAGLRTHVLVCLGSCLSSLTGMYLITCFQMGDPSRIASGVVSGIGFLGAGMIIVTNNSKVTGLTTAAAMWATACVGLAIGAGFYFGAILAAVLIVLTTTVLTVFEVRQKKDMGFYLELDDYTFANQVVDILRTSFPNCHNFDLGAPKSGISGHIGISLNINLQHDTAEEVIKKLLSIEHVVISIEA